TEYKLKLGNKEKTSQATSYIFTELNSATSYTILIYSGSVNGFEGVGRSGICITSTFPVRNLTKTKSTAISLTFHWRLAEGANAYRVELFRDNYSYPVDLGNVDTYTFVGLMADTRYYCKVYSGMENIAFETTGTILDEDTIRT